MDWSQASHLFKLSFEWNVLKWTTKSFSFLILQLLSSLSAYSYLSLRVIQIIQWWEERQTHFLKKSDGSLRESNERGRLLCWINRVRGIRLISLIDFWQVDNWIERRWDKPRVRVVIPSSLISEQSRRFSDWIPEEPRQMKDKLWSEISEQRSRQSVVRKGRCKWRKPKSEISEQPPMFSSRKLLTNSRNKNIAWSSIFESDRLSFFRWLPNEHPLDLFFCWFVRS